MRISATELNKRPGMYIDTALSNEPVIIEKNGRPSVVMISYDVFRKLDDAYWGEKALKTEKESTLSVKESDDFLTGDE